MDPTSAFWRCIELLEGEIFTHADSRELEELLF
jgi:hypothetical protein